MKETMIIFSQYVLVFILLIGFAEYMYHKIKVKAEITRKLVHLGSGVLSLSFHFHFGELWPVLFLCGSFFGILLLSQKTNLLKSINAVSRKTYGATLFPITVAVCFIIQLITGQLTSYFLALLVLSISDPLAALVGKRYPIGIYSIGGHQKTLLGSLAFFLSAYAISSLVLVCIGTEYTLGFIGSCLVFAAVSTILEAISKNGLDNLTIPLSIIATATLIQNPQLIC